MGDKVQRCHRCFMYSNLQESAGIFSGFILRLGRRVAGHQYSMHIGLLVWTCHCNLLLHWFLQPQEAAATGSDHSAGWPGGPGGPGCKCHRCDPRTRNRKAMSIYTWSMKKENLVNTIYLYYNYKDKSHIPSYRSCGKKKRKDFLF